MPDADSDLADHRPGAGRPDTAPLSAVRRRDPQHVPPPPRVGEPGGDEQQIRETVEIAQGLGVAAALRLDEGHGRPLGAAADGAGQMQGGRGRRTARQDERGQGRERLVERVDLPLQPLDLAGDDAQGGRGVAGLFGRGEIGAQVEEVVLDARQQRVEGRIAGGLKADEAEDGVELVDLAIGGDPGAGLADALAGGPGASRPCRRSGCRCG